MTPGYKRAGVAKAKRKRAAGDGAGSLWDLSAGVRSLNFTLKAIGSYEGAAASNPHFRKNILAHMRADLRTLRD